MTGAASLKDVLVVIPCLNEERHIGALLDMLLPQTPGALIVVADGGSGDRTVAIAQSFASRSPNVRILHNPARIQSAAINLAVERFGGGRKWLIRIDAHCEYPDHYVSGLLRAAEGVGAQSVTVPMRTIGHRCFQRAAAAAQNSKLGTGGSDHRVGKTGRFVDHGHHALMAMDAFIRAGGYCERMSHNEDAELDIRLAGVGARIWLEPALAIIYHPRGAPGALFRQYFSYGQGRARTMLRHKRRLRVRQAAPLVVAPATLLAIGGLIWPPLAIPAAAWAAICLIWGASIGFRSRQACEAASGFAAMIMHLAWSLGFWKGFLLRLFNRTGDEWTHRFAPDRKGDNLA